MHLYILTPRKNIPISTTSAGLGKIHPESKTASVTPVKPNRVKTLRRMKINANLEEIMLCNVIILDTDLLNDRYDFKSFQLT